MSAKLRYFVRLDARNKPVAGSNINRKKKPTGIGHFMEIYSPCCIPIVVNPTQTVALPTLSGGTPQYHIELENGILSTGDIDTGTITGANVVLYLNTNYSTLGTYTLSGTNVLFVPTLADTTLTITAGA